MAARGLGKGLDSLIPNAVGEAKVKKESKAESKEEKREDGKETVVKITMVGANREIQDFLTANGSAPLKTAASLAELICRPELS